MAATAITIVAAISLTFPNGFFEPIWKLNPRGRAGLGAIGMWAVLLFSVVGTACAVAAVGLWRGAPWGRWTAMAVLSIDLLGNVFNVISGAEPRAIIGIPIALLIVGYLITRRVRLFFSKPRGLN
ncbi:MAG: hypothetical protein M3Y84_08890 [Acidobacteriota bacterium]|nr:hypothetical protein [Acidobacteriota bacterium]